MILGDTFDSLVVVCALLMIMGNSAVFEHISLPKFPSDCMHQSYLCLRTQSEREQSRGSVSLFTSWASGLWAAGPPLASLWLINGETREFPVSTRGKCPCQQDSWLITSHHFILLYTFPGSVSRHASERGRVLEQRSERLGSRAEGQRNRDKQAIIYSLCKEVYWQCQCWHG